MNSILIVDDEPNILMSLDYALRKKNYEIFIARDGQEAIDILQENTPDIMLLDLMMPNVDGYETIEWVKKQENLNEMRIIIISAKNKEKDIEKALELGADFFIPKPFSVKNISQKIEELLKS